MSRSWFSYKNIPNVLTVARALLVLPFVWCIHDIFVYECAKNLFLLITFTTIISSDVLDGFLARKLACTSQVGAKLDIISDTFYTISWLITFAYFEIIPAWFILVIVLKLFEFVITSRIIGRKQQRIIFDRIGKVSISIVMILPGVFVFRCIMIDYKTIMGITIFIVTAMLIVSSVSRIANTIKHIKASS